MKKGSLVRVRTEFVLNSSTSEFITVNPGDYLLLLKDPIATHHFIDIDLLSRDGIFKVSFSDQYTVDCLLEVVEEK